MATVTAVPDSDQLTDAWTSTPLWSKVDDDIDAPDGTVIVSPNNPGAGQEIEFTLDDPVPAGEEVDTVELRIRARKVSSTKTMTLKVILRDSADAEVASFTTPALSQTLTNYSGGTINVANIPKAAWADYDVRVEPSTTGGGAPNQIEIDALNVELVTVVATQTISPSAIPSAEAFGTPTLTPGPVTVSPVAIASEAAFGTAKLGLQVKPVAIPGLEAFGTPTLTQILKVYPAAIASAEALGTPQLNLTLRPVAIPSLEAFGTPQIYQHITVHRLPDLTVLASRLPDLTLSVSRSPDLATSGRRLPDLAVVGERAPDLTVTGNP